jgi:hypothetical protein
MAGHGQTLAEGQNHCFNQGIQTEGKAQYA